MLVALRRLPLDACDESALWRRAIDDALWEVVLEVLPHGPAVAQLAQHERDGAHARGVGHDDDLPAVLLDASELEVDDAPAARVARHADHHVRRRQAVVLLDRAAVAERPTPAATHEGEVGERRRRSLGG